jgi:hypothetical protein
VGGKAVLGCALVPRRPKKASPARSAPSAPLPSPRWPLALALFGWALVIRVLFWLATPDAGWPYSVFFKGDAALWLDYALALRDGRPFELGLPLRPPANAYLLAALWDGTAAGVRWLRWWWAALGALVPALVFLAAERPFGRRAALIAGGLCATSNGLILSSASLNNETPYVLLVLSSLLMIGALREHPHPARVAGFSALNAAAALFRAEHVLLYAVLLAWLAWGWWRRGERTPAAVSLAAFALLLAPWHVASWRAVHRFNTQPPATAPGEEAALRQAEGALWGLDWEPGAQAARDRLPAFLRRQSAAFVAATVAHRGGRVVRAEDFGILTDAFGAPPAPLAARPLIALYGPLNFALAHHPRASGGFSRAALEDPPPLSGGAHRYPPALVEGLPPPQLTLAYPPHAGLVGGGYAVGARWIAEAPGRSLRLSLHKLRLFWGGAATGFGGANLPLGLAGLRRAVDLAVAEEGVPVWAWQLAVLALAVYGLVRARSAELVPWLLWLGTKLLVTVAFFGYARQGAAVFPVVALLMGLALDRLMTGRLGKRRARVALAAWMAVSVGLEAARLVRGPEVFVDGLPITAGDPFPADLHRDQRIDVR